MHSRFLYEGGMFIVPLFFTAMLGTITYPLAIRIVRSKRLFGMKDKGLIHLTIAPFLSYIHLNFFSIVKAHM